jgi:hypothetical protein
VTSSPERLRVEAAGLDPDLLARAAAAPPFFVVGSPRSGTTLVRMMLDCHPNLAVPRESHFVVGLAGRRFRMARRPQLAIERILTHPRFAVWGLDPDLVRAAAGVLGPRTYADAVRVAFATWAAAAGKARWGDKTPGYVSHIPLLARLFPDARFVHVIRDGREVAASVAETWFGPDDPVAAAYWWRARVRDGLRDGRRLGTARYMELHLRDLIADPERAMRQVLDFLGEPWSPAVLDYRAKAEAFLAQRATNPRMEIHRHLVKPPTPGLRDWRAGLSPRTCRLVEAACAPVLAGLGYPVGPVRWADTVAARLRQLAAVRSEVVPAVRLRMKRWRREF